MSSYPSIRPTRWSGSGVEVSHRFSSRNGVPTLTRPTHSEIPADIEVTAVSEHVSNLEQTNLTNDSQNQQMVAVTHLAFLNFENGKQMTINSFIVWKLHYCRWLIERLINFHFVSPLCRHVLIDEEMTARINMGDAKFSFQEKGKSYAPAWSAPEGEVNFPAWISTISITL